MEKILDEPKYCRWKEEDQGESWSTFCGNAWSFFDGGPTDNKVVYCPFCGRKLREAE